MKPITCTVTLEDEDGVLVFNDTANTVEELEQKMKQKINLFLGKF